VKSKGTYNLVHLLVCLYRLEHVGFCINVVTVVKMCAFVQIILSYICKVFASSLQKLIWYDMICLLTAVGLTPSGSSTVHIYTQTVHRTIQ
jgi:hypothetical protein